MIFERVRKIICDQLDLDPEIVTEATVLEDFTQDSLYIFDLAQSLETAFDVTFHDEDLEELKTVGDFVEFLENN